MLDKRAIPLLRSSPPRGVRYATCVYTKRYGTLKAEILHHDWDGVHDLAHGSEAGSSGVSGVEERGTTTFVAGVTI
jgi:hypothetical protein